MTYTPKTKLDKLDALERSPEAILQNAKAARNLTNELWGIAARAPMFCRVTSKTKNKHGKTASRHRSSRLIRRNAYTVAASGAAAYVSSLAMHDCGFLRVKSRAESARAPWKPRFSPGAKMLIEQFLAALGAEAHFKAHAFREGTCQRKSMTASHAKLGWEATCKSVFNATTMLCANVDVLPLEKVKRTTPSQPKTSSGETQGMLAKVRPQKAKKAKMDKSLEEDYDDDEDGDNDNDNDNDDDEETSGGGTGCMADITGDA